MVILSILVVTLSLIKCLFASSYYRTPSPLFLFFNNCVYLFVFFIVSNHYYLRFYFIFFWNTWFVLSMPFPYLLRNACKQISLNKIIAIMGFYQ